VSSVSCEWELADHDINFGVRFEPTDPASESLEILPTNSHTAADGPVHNTFEVPQGSIGRLLIVWDNSHSYLRSKSVTFRVLPADVLEAK